MGMAGPSPVDDIAAYSASITKYTAAVTKFTEDSKAYTASFTA